MTARSTSRSVTPAKDSRTSTRPPRNTLQFVGPLAFLSLGDGPLGTVPAGPRASPFSCGRHRLLHQVDRGRGPSVHHLGPDPEVFLQEHHQSIWDTTLCGH